MKQEDYEKVLLYSEMTKNNELDNRPILCGLDLRGVDFTDLHLSEANLAHSDFSGGKLYDVFFTAVNLYGCVFESTKIKNCRFTDCLMKYVTFETAVITDTRFLICDLFQGRLYNSSLNTVHFYSSNLNRADFQYADVIHCDFSGANLSKTDLSHTVLDDSLFYDTVLKDNTKELKKALRSTLQSNGGLILYRTNRSLYNTETIYKVGKTYVANAFSRCPVTECHPGIYGMSLESFVEKFARQDFVRIYAPMGEWHFVSEGKGFRCRRVRVLEEHKWYDI